MGNYLRTPTQSYHIISLSITWSVIANTAVFFALYKYKFYGVYMHMLLSWLVILITFSSVVTYLLNSRVRTDPDKFSQIQIFLSVEAAVLLGWTGVQLFTGYYSRIYQQYNQGKSSTLIKIKLAHQISGYIYLILGKINTIMRWRNYNPVFYTLIGFQAFCIILYIMRKLFFPKISERIENPQINEEIFVKTIKSINQLDNNSSVITFSDYVYNANPLITLHPGGYQLIKSVMGRQVDRYIYGMYSNDLLPNISPHSHSFKALSLIGNPIAKIQRNSLYKMQKLNKCKISQIHKISQSGKIYLLYLSSFKSDTIFSSNGYSDLSQLGRYFSLTLNYKTRLYTCINCFSKYNQGLMSHISKQMTIKDNLCIQIRSKNQIIRVETQTELIQMPSDRNFINKLTTSSFNTIPIMFRYYESGSLTPLLISQTQSRCLQISQLKGQGLNLSYVKPGKIIIFAGGLGINPFLDLIDLLFKQVICNENHNMKNKILQYEQILNSNFLEGYQFQFFIALNNDSDLTPMTYYQLNYLSKEKNNDRRKNESNVKSRSFKSTLKIKNGQQTIKNKYKQLQFSRERFISFYHIIQLHENISKFYICGPPSMNSQFAKQFHQNNVQHDKYHFL